MYVHSGYMCADIVSYANSDLTFSFIMLKNGQTYFKNLAAFTLLVYTIAVFHYYVSRVKKCSKKLYFSFTKPKRYGNQRYHYLTNSSVMRQKGECQNGCSKKAKHVKISEKQLFLIHRAYLGVRNNCFSEILVCFAFLKHPF